MAWENAQEKRHEFWRGEIFDMGGARRVHGEVVGTVVAALRGVLKGAPCRAFAVSMKVQLADDTLFYPDVFVTCDPHDLKTDRVFKSPKLVVEVWRCFQKAPRPTTAV